MDQDQDRMPATHGARTHETSPDLTNRGTPRRRAARSNPIGPEERKRRHEALCASWARLTPEEKRQRTAAKRAGISRAAIAELAAQIAADLAVEHLDSEASR